MIQGYFQRILSMRSTSMATALSITSMFGCMILAFPSALIGVVARATDWSTVQGFNKSIIAHEANAALPIVLRYLTPQWVSFVGKCRTLRDDFESQTNRSPLHSCSFPPLLLPDSFLVSSRRSGSPSSFPFKPQNDKQSEVCISSVFLFTRVLSEISQRANEPVFFAYNHLTLFSHSPHKAHTLSLCKKQGTPRTLVT